LSARSVPARRAGTREGGAANFPELNDAQLAELSDEGLIAQIVRARAAGRLDAAVRASQILAFNHQERVIGFMYNQLGSKGPQVVEEVAAQTIADAVKSAASFEGEDLRTFRAWLFRIARFRRVDYLRKKRVDTIPLVFRGSEESEEREFGMGDPLIAIDDASVFNQAFAELNKDSHKLVILLSLHHIPHRQIAEKVNRQFNDTDDDTMSENNVSQIISRFHKRLDELLDEADDPPPPPDDDD
jgi:RNA polymerase sigma factor (sigma-70 family)